MFESKLKIIGPAFVVEVDGEIRVLKPHHIDAVRAFCNPAYVNRIAAIKFIRAEYGLGLKDAKDLVDVISEPRVRTMDEQFALRA